MMESMDQWTKMMEKMSDPWKAMMTNIPSQMKPAVNVQDAWSAWFNAVQSGCEMNATWWRTFMDQSEDMFFKTLKDSPMRTDALEQQMRDLWAGAKKAQHTQQDAIKDQLVKTENLVKEQTAAPSAGTGQPKAPK